MGPAGILTTERLCPAQKWPQASGRQTTASAFQGCLLACTHSCTHLVSPSDWKGPNSSPTDHHRQLSPPTLTAQTGALGVPDLELLGGHVGGRVRLSACEPDLEPRLALAGGHQSWCHLVSIWLNRDTGQQVGCGLWAS